MLALRSHAQPALFEAFLKVAMGGWTFRLSCHTHKLRKDLLPLSIFRIILNTVLGFATRRLLRGQRAAGRDGPGRPGRPAGELPPFVGVDVIDKSSDILAVT